MRQTFAGAVIVVTLLLGGSAAAQTPVSCNEETAQLRYLVQFYAAGRTQTEFALAKAEAGRQAAEARVKTLEAAIKALESARGQK